jgi:prophage regulatory protein
MECKQMNGSSPGLDRFIRLPELIRITGLSRPTIYRLIAKNEFPAPFALSPNSKGWKASQIRAWQDSLKQVEVGS